MRRFFKFHPLTLFCYFITVAGITMTGQNPAIILISLFSAVLVTCLFMGAKSAGEGLWFYILLILAVTLINPIFSQNGKTVLLTVFNRVITLEAILYGLFQGLMILAVIYWFRVFSFIFTTDKLLLIFGKYMPKLALTLSMALRFIPLFKRQLVKISETQKTLGLYREDKTRNKIKAASKVFISVLAWAPENAIDTYDAMLAKGFSGKKITSADDFKFSFADIAFVLIIIGIFAFFIKFISETAFSFYNNDKFFASFDIVSFCLVAALFLCPSFLYIKENIIWKYSISKI